MKRSIDQVQTAAVTTNNSPCTTSPFAAADTPASLPNQPPQQANKAPAYIPQGLPQRPVTAYSSTPSVANTNAPINHNPLPLALPLPPSASIQAQGFHNSPVSSSAWSTGTTGTTAFSHIPTPSSSSTAFDSAIIGAGASSNGKKKQRLNTSSSSSSPSTTTTTSPSLSLPHPPPTRLDTSGANRMDGVSSKSPAAAAAAGAGSASGSPAVGTGVGGTTTTNTAQLQQQQQQVYGMYMHNTHGQGAGMYGLGLGNGVAGIPGGAFSGMMNGSSSSLGGAGGHVGLGLGGSASPVGAAGASPYAAYAGYPSGAATGIGGVGGAGPASAASMMGSPIPGQGHQGQMQMPMGLGRLPGTLPNGAMDPAQMTGNYGPAAAAAAAAAAGNTTGRTVYVGNLPSNANVDELMNLVRFGPVESVRLLPEKSCVFISFLDGATAAAFHADATVKKLTLHGQELKIGWGKPSTVPNTVVHAIATSKATRNVYLGGLDEKLSESELRDDLSRFGPIDQVKIVRDKSIGFVHFLSISAAMKVVNTLATEPAWVGKRIGYGKDRCAYVPRAQQAAVQAAQQQAAAALGHTLGMPGAPFQAFNPQSPAALYSRSYTPSYGPSGYPASGMTSPVMGGAHINGGDAMDPNGGGAYGNRCVFLGNLPEDTTPEDVANAVKGGLVTQIRYLPEKNIAFITFADVNAAGQFHHLASTVGLIMNSNRLKIGWGKPTGPVSPTLAALLKQGASRNVYVGNIVDFDTFNESKLREDFSHFGEIEQINFLKEKKAAFINFLSLPNAAKAIDGIKKRPEYAELRVSYGKDRCANPPRAGHFGQEVRPRRDGQSATPSVPPTTKQANNDGPSEEDDADVAKTENLVADVKAESSDDIISQVKGEDLDDYQRGEKDD